MEKMWFHGTCSSPNFKPTARFSAPIRFGGNGITNVDEIIRFILKGPFMENHGYPMPEPYFKCVGGELLELPR
jgi:hypothetical protein